MNVRVRSKYSLRSGDLHLLPENKMRWWMKSEDKEGKDAFVKIPRDAIGNDPLDVDVDLTPGRYSAGCGEWNVKNSEGRSVYQRLYFYVTADGQVVYVSRKDELPELHDIIEGNVPVPVSGGGDFSPFESYEKKSSASEYVTLTDVLYCNKATDDGNDTLIQRIVMSGDACEEYVEDTPGADFGCGNCIFAKQVYRNK